jgi:hypothetical protein
MVVEQVGVPIQQAETRLAGSAMTSSTGSPGAQAFSASESAVKDKSRTTATRSASASASAATSAAGSVARTIHCPGRSADSRCCGIS